MPLSLSPTSYLHFPPSGFSLRWYTELLTRDDWLQPIVRSVEIAAITAPLATLFGGAAAIGLHRTKSRVNALVTAILLAPIIIPSLVTAVALYFQFAAAKLIGTLTGMVLAHMVVAIPLAFVVARGALESYDLRPEQAARSLGAGPLRAFIKVGLPAVASSLLGALLFAFLASFDEVVLSLFMSGSAMTTLPKRIWDSIFLEVTPTVAAAAVLVTVISLVVAFVGEFVRSRFAIANKRRASN